MHRFTLLIITVCGLFAVHVATPPCAIAQWYPSDGHYHHVPHSETHMHVVPHGDHYDLVPHTTTHYHDVWHGSNDWNSDNVIYSESSRPVVVTNRIPSSSTGNVIPSAKGGTITLLNPTENSGPVNYKVNSFAYTANPGDSQTLKTDRNWTITFDNGLGRRVTQRLEQGSYQFVVNKTDGWSLARVDDADAPAAPKKTSAAAP